MFVLLLHVPILMGTPFANPEIHLASEFTAFILLVIGAQQANHVSDGTCDLIHNLFAYYILAYITL